MTLAPCPRGRAAPLAWPESAHCHWPLPCGQQRFGSRPAPSPSRPRLQFFANDLRKLLFCTLTPCVDTLERCASRTSRSPPSAPQTGFLAALSPARRPLASRRLPRSSRRDDCPRTPYTWSLDRRLDATIILPYEAKKQRVPIQDDTQGLSYVEQTPPRSARLGQIAIVGQLKAKDRETCGSGQEGEPLSGSQQAARTSG